MRLLYPVDSADDWSKDGGEEGGGGAGDSPGRLWFRVSGWIGEGWTGQSPKMGREGGVGRAPCSSSNTAESR